MKPKRIFLVRHGESEGNVNKDVYKTIPDWKVPLTIKGKEQADQAAFELRQRIDPQERFAIYVSPWYRTVETAKSFRDMFYSRCIYCEDPRLREQEWGNYQEDHLVQKIKDQRKKYGSFFYRIPYGESGADVYDRVTTFLETLHRDFKKEDFPENVLIVSHGLTIKAFLMRWFHLSVEWFDKIDTPENCQLIEMELESKLSPPWENRLLPSKYLLKTELKENEDCEEVI